MLFQKILISTVILLAAACTPPEESATKGDSSATLPPRAVAPPPPEQPRLRRLALVIGNSDYAGDNFLTNPVNDARALAEVLRQPELGFEVISKVNLNRQQMKAAVREFSNKLAKEQGVGLFYFSGHGLQYKGVNYLIPLGTQHRLTAAYELPDETVTMDYVLSAMKTVENKVNLLILDACRNPPRFVKSWYKGDMIPPGLTLPLRTPDASLIAYAAAPGQVALSGEGQNNSPYVKSLMKWIQVPNLSIMDALTQVRQEVIDTTYQQQQPEFSVALNKPFYFNPQATPPTNDLAEQRLADKNAQLQAERERFEPEKARLQAVPVPDTYRLTVLATPADSQIKIMNIVPKYVPGIALKPGKYDVLVEKGGHVTSRQWITIQNQDVTLPVVLAEQSNNIFRDNLQDGSQGPEMVWIPRGSFRMGDIQGGGSSDEKPVHSVSVSRFAMGRYEVTVGQFRRFVNATGYRTDAEKGDGCYTSKDGSWNKVKDANWQKLYFSQNDNHPVACVSWNDATAYAKWLSQQTGHTYRLPTEAQWEYAARAGTTTSRYWGNDPNDACRYANVHDNTSKKENKGFSWTPHNCTDGYAQTAPVGSFKPNAFALFDMLGNIWEWTCSEFESKYAGKEQRCANGGSRFALRGGSWGSIPGDVRAAFRFRGSGVIRDGLVGFRLARSS